MVHIACCLANVFCRLSNEFKDSKKKIEILSAATASSMAVAFGAPIGGVLFSLEGMSFVFPRKTMLCSFVCAMISAVVLKVV